MTDVELKLQDAATQMLLTIANSSDEKIFRSCINAFLSHARSVTFVMEAHSSNPALKGWYKAQMARLGDVPLLRFLTRNEFTVSIKAFSRRDPFHIKPPNQNFATKPRRTEGLT